MNFENIDANNNCNVCCECNTTSTAKSRLIPGYNKLNRIILGIIVFLIAIIVDFSFLVYFGLILFSYLLAGGEVIFKAGVNITRGKVFDENFLMTIATIGAFAIGEYPEAAAVMLFYQVGILFESAAINRSKRSIETLMEVRPDYANLQTENGYERVAPEKVQPGDIILVKPGEKVPIDGKVIKGTSTVDTSILTGESYPERMTEGDEILSGYINNNGLLTVEVTKEFYMSTVSKVLELVQNATEKKAPTEKFITRFARYYTPVVVSAAVVIALIPPLLLTEATFSQWIYRALVFLVISCPCALVVSIPIGFVGGIGKASRNGILVKGSNYLEALNQVDTVIFDKTGTITQGTFKVTEIKPAPGLSEEELIKLGAIAEISSNHPIAEAVKKAYKENIQKKNKANSEGLVNDALLLELEEYESYEEIPGMGVKVKLTNGQEILAGNGKLLESVNYNIDDEPLNSTIVHLLVDGNYAGHIKVSDKLKDKSQVTIDKLREMGIKILAILTGDTKEVAMEFGRKLGINRIYASLLPQEKLSKLEDIYLQRKKDHTIKGKLLYIGDGINDAPVIARADIGVAMGGLGSDASIKSSDIVLMTDEPDKLVTAMNIAKETRWVVWQNIGLSFGVKGLVLVLGALGLATMWQAVIADVGVMVLAAVNSLRLSFS